MQQSLFAGYGNTKWDMSVKEVMSAESSIQTIDKPENSGNGSKALLEKNDVSIGNKLFKIRYYFEPQGGLSSVNVVFLNKNSFKENNNAFEMLLGLLTDKYGKPQNVSQDNSMITWRETDTYIKLRKHYINSLNFYQVSITYYPYNKVKDIASDL